MKKTRASWDCLYCIAATNSQSIQGTEKEKLFELPPFLIPNKELQEREIQMKTKKNTSHSIEISKQSFLSHTLSYITSLGDNGWYHKIAPFS